MQVGHLPLRGSGEQRNSLGEKTLPGVTVMKPLAKLRAPFKINMDKTKNELLVVV